ncbi:restriction endonuclease subunit S [Ectopseudomonas khazarica]|uniref:restriction endonuclease subunit S n=1 Tax=Ectopseudomonas khazarica TaxID=2502979 RepID=UPI0009B8D25E
MSAKVKWPCKFPDRWTVLPSKRLFPESKERAPESDEQLSATQEYGVISQAEFMRLAGRRVVQLNQNLELRKRVEIGDFVISMRSFQGGLERAWAEGGIRSSYVVLRPRADLVPGYYQRLFKSVDYIQTLQATANFIRDGQDMNYQNFVLIDLPLPPVSEQLSIAAFLDHETARIDALIEEQQRLIELLKEKRQAVISHAVTKGLDPTVPMKESGVEWLGEVPAHWDVARVKNVAKLESGHTPSKDFPEYWEGGDIPWVSLNDSKQLKVTDYIVETQFMITELGVSNSSARLLPARAVVFTRDATIGLAAITTKKMCVSQHLIAWICNETFVLPEYLLLVFYAMEEELDRFTFGATIKTIGMPDIRKLVTPVPPLAEQAQLVADVNAKRELIDQLIKESNTALALYLERRSALISAAVTGKIDVRGWQPPVSPNQHESLQA